MKATSKSRLSFWICQLAIMQQGKIVYLNSDTANVMFGRNNSVVSR